MAEQVGICLSRNALRGVFERAGYHRQIAPVKPVLSVSAHSRPLAWAQHFQDWKVEDWRDVIWSNECSFSVDEVCGTVCITRRPREAYLEDCLVSRLARRSTIMVWGAIYGDQKKLLVIWDTPSWGTINSQTYINGILQPHLHP